MVGLFLALALPEWEWGERHKEKVRSKPGHWLRPHEEELLAFSSLWQREILVFAVRPAAKEVDGTKREELRVKIRRRSFVIRVWRLASGGALGCASE